MYTRIIKWGDGLGIRLPKQFTRKAGLTEGSSVDMAVIDHRVVVTPITPRYSLADLLKDTTPETYGASGVDWGADVGREIVD